MRAQAAYLERQGQTVDWDPQRTEALVEAFDRHLKEREKTDGSNPPRGNLPGLELGPEGNAGDAARGP